jgi:hypothetical protein
VTAGLTGCNHRTPLPPAARLWITGPAGCSRHADGVQPAPSRGAAVAPEPSKEPCPEPSAAPARGAPGAARSRRARRRRRAGWRVLRRARRGLAADRSPAVQADSGRAGGAQRGLDIARAGQVRRGKRRRRPEPVRDAGRPALGCRAAPAARPAAAPAAVVPANATSTPGWPASTATSRIPARAASRRPARSSAAPAQTARTTCMAVLRTRRALAPGRPSAEPTRCTATMRQVPPSTRTRSVHAGNDHPGR